MTNSRCGRTDLSLNRFVPSTKCNSTRVLSADSIRDELNPPDETVPISGRDEETISIRKAPGTNPRPHQTEAEHFQISSPRGLTPLTSFKERVLPSSRSSIKSPELFPRPPSGRSWGPCVCPKLPHRSLGQTGAKPGANGPNGVEAIETPGRPLEEVARGVSREGDQGGGTNRKSRAMPQWIVVQ